MRTTLPIPYLELHTTTKIPPASKDYFCFQIHGRSSHANHCVKSIYTFEQKCALIKGILQSPHIEDHMKSIGIDQLLCNMSSFEHKCVNNIKYIYQHARKCDDQQNIKGILYYDMVSTLEEVIDDSLSFPMTSTIVQKPSARISL